MPEELSELHKEILKAALRNREKAAATPDLLGKPDLYDHEAMHEIYGFPYREGGWFKKLPDPRREPGGEFFSEKAIGEDRLKTVKADAARAFAELDASGLCTRVIGADPEWTGIRLTLEGTKVAKNLTLARNEPIEL